VNKKVFDFSIWRRQNENRCIVCILTDMANASAVRL